MQNTWTLERQLGHTAGSPDILLLVLFSYRDVATIGLQFVLLELPKGIVLDAEGMVQYRCDVILPETRESVNQTRKAISSRPRPLNPSHASCQESVHAICSGQGPGLSRELVWLLK